MAHTLCTYVTTVTATDRDVSGNTIAYQSDSGKSTPFELDTNTGVITVSDNSLNASTNSTYMLIIKATDGTFDAATPATVNIIVTVDNCASSPCLNGGACINAPTSCICADGYTGTTCTSATVTTLSPAATAPTTETTGSGDGGSGGDESGGKNKWWISLIVIVILIICAIPFILHCCGIINLKELWKIPRNSESERPCEEESLQEGNGKTKEQNNTSLDHIKLENLAPENESGNKIKYWNASTISNQSESNEPEIGDRTLGSGEYVNTSEIL